MMNKIIRTFRSLYKNTTGGGGEIVAMLFCISLALVAGLYITNKIGTSAKGAGDKESTQIDAIKAQ
jgi:hypothetical protein